MKTSLSVLAVLALAVPAQAISLDGVVVDAQTPGGGVALATQTVNTHFGDATGGTQESAGGSELNQLFAEINPTTKKLEVGITGNLESNNNKLFIFFDAVDGGETVLGNDNADGGFGEINQMAGLQFMGASMDHGLRLNLGGGNLEITFFDLIDNSAISIINGGGFGDLPISSGGGARGINVGWDNSNTLGVSGDNAGTLVDPTTATTGFEFEIDVIDAFNGSQGDIMITALVTSADGTFASNQFLPSSGSTTNLGNGITTFNSATVTVMGDPIEGAALGDTTGDGLALLEDFDPIRDNWLETNETFGMQLTRANGDLNLNGEVSIEDFREWKDAFLLAGGSQAQVAQAFSSLNAAPEPGSAVLLAVGLVGLCRGRRRS